MPPTFTLTVSADDGRPVLAADFEVRGGAPECRAVHLVSTEDGREVRAGDLSEVNVAKLLKYAAASVGMPYEVTGSGDSAVVRSWKPSSAEELQGTVDAVSTTRKGRRGRPRFLTDDMLREVAAVYRAAGRDKPTEAVRRHFGVEHRTAARYVKRARLAHFLGDALPGKAGEQQ
jgi:hypothetical protein